MAKKVICGVDEAGRGPVIGPMVLAGVTIAEDSTEEFSSLGIKDSKLLSILRRNELFEIIKSKALDFRINIIPPDKIDKALSSDSLNLNWLEAIESAKIANQMKFDKIILDCPSANPPAYQEYFARLLIERGKEIVCEHKADFNYVVVSAASVLAKVTRDFEIEKIKKRIGVDFGSGYPSDPRTSKFLKENFKRYPEIFRRTWQSYKKLVDAEKQSSLGSF